ncbi:carboxypeptidase regulatory-like domain-containing protein [Aeromicrobium sp.]|uniref:carboxypeptidase regulatory-like domain-containing protein n=1 Tax=Aeromicrobium sp. TaxID=1871063 RepID=UPI0030C078C8
MAGGWRVTARMMAAAAAARAVSRAADSMRKLLAEVEQPALSGPTPTPPPPPTFVESPAQLAPVMIHSPAVPERVVAAHVEPPHEFGPTRVITPSHGIGFRSEPRRPQPVAEMPVISRPGRPDEPDDVAPAQPVNMPESVHTAAAIVQDLDEDDEFDDDELDDDMDDDSDPEPLENDKQPESAAEDDAAEPEDEPLDEPDEVADIEEEVPEPEPVPVFVSEPVSEPVFASVRPLRLSAPPVEDTPVAEEDAAPVGDLTEPVFGKPTTPSPGPPIGLVPAPADQATGDRPLAETTDRRGNRGKHRRHRSAVSGTVQSSRGRGLRGMVVNVLDERGEVVGTTLTGTGGSFIVEELPAGNYRLGVSDQSDGDFAASWHGESARALATILKVKDGRTRRKADVTLVAIAEVDLDVDLRKKKAIVHIAVTDRATGTPAEGSVRVSTKLFSTQLALNEGRATITLFGSAKGSPALTKKVDVTYLGSKHTRAAASSAKLR